MRTVPLAFTLSTMSSIAFAADGKGGGGTAMPITILFATLTGLIAIVLWIGLADRQQAERQEARLEAALERASFERAFLLERGQVPPPELETRIEELRAELAEAQAERRAAQRQAREEAEGVRQGIRELYAEPAEPRGQQGQGGVQR